MPERGRLWKPTSLRRREGHTMPAESLRTDMFPEEPGRWPIWAAMPWPFCARMRRMDGGTTLPSSVWQLESLVSEHCPAARYPSSLPRVAQWPGL